MDYLKIFEALQYYTECTAQEYGFSKDHWGNNAKDLSIEKIEKIKAMWPDNFEYSRFKNGLLYVPSQRTIISMKIREQTDNWYYIEIDDHDDDKNLFHKYFKCDQWDGLLMCIKKELINRKRKPKKILEAVGTNFEIRTRYEFDKDLYDIEDLGTSIEIFRMLNPGDDIARYIELNHRDFDTSISKRISRVVDKRFNKYKLGVKKDNVDIRIEGNIMKVTFMDNNYHMDIYRLRDEWYYVMTYRTTESGYKRRKYYKCDQLDGLVECINKVDFV